MVRNTTAVLRGIPAEEQTDVPTDVVPAFDAERLGLGFVRGSNDLTFTLRLASGDPVQLTPDEFANGQYLVVRPARELEPNTPYVLALHVAPLSPDEDAQDLSVSFSTGAGPLDSVAQPISGSVQHWWAREGGGEDFPGEGTCVGIAGNDLVEARFLDPDDASGAPSVSDSPYAGLHVGPFLANLGDGASGYQAPCIRLRRRAINDTFSEPTVTCGTYAPIYVIGQGGEASSKCTESGFIDTPTMTTLSAPLPANAGHSSAASTWSCNLPRQRSPSFATSLLVLALGVCAAVRRARAHTATPAGP